MEDRYINEKEAARITGYSRYWFQAKRVSGDGPPFRKTPTGSIRYSLAELMGWMNLNLVRHHTSETAVGTTATARSVTRKRLPVTLVAMLTDTEEEPKRAVTRQQLPSDLLLADD